ncbi:MAG: methyltransferase, partial [Pseudarcicella sp.]|nr:methyltransferase [Pseudarcicella sp.]
MEESDNRAPQRIKNNFFRFKQFVVHQSLSGMKVTTEACLLGAKVPVENCKHILDIGSGTGLLSLMMAQRTQACITGVEIDEKAYQQSVENSKKSPFYSQIVFLNQSIQRFSETQMALLQRQYFDLIVSNPPFFTNHLQT